MDLDWRYLWSGLSDRKYLIIFKIRWSTDSCTSGSRSDFNGLDHRQFWIVLFTETPLSVFRIAGAVMVILGVVWFNGKRNKLPVRSCKNQKVPLCGYGEHLAFCRNVKCHSDCGKRLSWQSSRFSDKSICYSLLLELSFWQLYVLFCILKMGNQNHSKMNRLKIPGGCGSVESLADYIFLQMSIYQEL